MKIFKNLLLVCFALTLSFYSCSTSDTGDNDGDTELADQQNATEERKIPLSEIESGVNIDGASSNTGTPPAPTNNINFQVATNAQEAFQENGLVISFSSTDNFAGAYILFQDVDGNKSNNYFEVPSSVIESAKSTNPKHSKLFSLTKKTDNDYELSVDFDNIEPGQFCYEICIFDENNNVSRIEKVCVEVEAWGGNAAIVGEWIYESSGDNDDLAEVSCESGQTIEVLYDDIIEEEYILKLESNGNFLLDSYEKYKELDWIATRNNCSAIYEDEVIENDARDTGKWAYNETNKTFTLVSFKYEDFSYPEDSEDYPDGELYFEGDKIEIINGKLVITENYTEEGQTYTETYTFRRK